jgi:hypothetical protein
MELQLHSLFLKFIKDVKVTLLEMLLRIFFVLLLAWVLLLLGLFVLFCFLIQGKVLLYRPSWSGTPYPPEAGIIEVHYYAQYCLPFLFAFSFIEV